MEPVTSQTTEPTGEDSIAPIQLPVDMSAYDLQNDKASDIMNKWFQKHLRMRWLELLTEFGASNLFFVSGDALVLEFLRESHLSWTGPLALPQLLHFVFAVERFLKLLADSGCVFRLVFFRCMRDAYADLKLKSDGAAEAMPVGETATLARDMLVAHLKRSHKLGIDVEDHLENFWDAEWHSYLESESPGFVLLSPMWGASGRIVTQLQCFLLHLFSQRVSLAFLSEIQFTDNRIYTFCLEPYDRRAEIILFDKIKTELAAEAPKAPKSSLAIAGATVDTLASFDNDWRATVCALAAKTIFESSPSAEERDLLKIVVLHVVLLNHLNLEERAWRLPSSHHVEINTLENFAQKLLKTFDAALVALDKVVPVAEYGSGHGLETLVDLVDWRIFSLLTHCLLISKSQDFSLMSLPQTLQDEFNKIWKFATSTAATPLFESAALKARLGLGLFEKAQLDAIDAGEDVLAGLSDPLPVRSPITDFILSELKPRLPKSADYSTQQQLASHSRKFFEDFRWHSGRKITLEESSLADDGSGGGYRNTQSYLNFVERFSQSLNAKPSWRPRLRTANPDPELKKRIQTELNEEAARSANIRNMTKRAKDAQGELDKVNNLIKDAEAVSIAERRRLFESFRGQSRLASIEMDFNLMDVIAEQFQHDRDRNFPTMSQEARDEKQLRYATDVMKLIFDLIEVYKDTTALTPARKKKLIEVPLLFGLFDVATAIQELLGVTAKELGATAQVLRTTAKDVGLSSARFQLKCMGPFMERDTSSIKDSRVPFLADAWQVQVLNAIDERKSLLVVAPTSAGKTFISFYAMEQVLKDPEHTDGIVVYVAPTKALVNQVAAEVYAQFAKAAWLKNAPGIQTYGVFTRDYRFFPTKCRVLVTVPQCLEILLLSPSHFSTWRKKLRYVIFDEIHSINQDEGSVWERLVSMVPCPAIALSATIGESQIFASWLQSVAKRTGHHFEHIVHPHRFSDLQKNLLIAQKVVEKQKDDKQTEHTVVDLEYLHPWATFTMRQFAKEIPPDVALSPRDCLELYVAMERAVALGKVELSAEDKARFAAINPDKFFNDTLVISQRRCRHYEVELKLVFSDWIKSKKPLVAAALEELSRAPLSKYAAMLKQFALEDVYSKKFMTQTAPEIFLMLKRNGLLPAIAFNFERKYCEDMCIKIFKFLEDKEKTWRQSPEYLESVRKYNRGKELAKQHAAAQAKSGQKRQQLADEQTNAALFDQGIDPSDLMHPDCTFTTPGEVMPRSELDADIASIGDAVPAVLARALRRGVGVHHSGLHKKYLQTVERYFRSGQVKVVFATGTLALGINMPCKTALFVGDSNFLTPLQYRQMSGRAGRRGFDPIGNVVFFGVPPQKIRKLEGSSLPILRGHFPFTTSYLLRTLVLGCGTPAGAQVADFKTLYARPRNAIQEAPAPAPVVEDEPVDDWELLDEDEAEPAAAEPTPAPAPVPVEEPENDDESHINLPKELQHISSVIAGFFRDPLFCLQRNYLQEQVTNHVRFGLEFLVRAGLISLHGEPVNLAGIVTHLSYTEPSNFVLCELLVSSAMHNLCARNDWAFVSRTLVHIMATLFCRLAVPQSLQDDVEKHKGDEKFKPHTIVLPPVPADVQEVLDKHDENILKVYASSVMHFVRKNADKLGCDNQLPLSDYAFPRAGQQAHTGIFANFVRNHIGAAEVFKKLKISALARSPFVALSGLDDRFTSAADLSETVRAGVFLPPEAMPSLDMYNLAGKKTALNAYILDSWNWTNRDWVEEKNHVRDADSFAQLKEFLLVLKAVAVALHRRVVPAGTPFTHEDTPDPVVNAFKRLADEFEEKFAKMFGTSIYRRFIIRIGGMRGDLRDFRKIPMDKEIQKKTRITIKSWRFGVDEQHRIVLKIEARSAADLQQLAEKASLWLNDGWRILEVRKETKETSQ